MAEKINMGMHPLLNKGGSKTKRRWMFSLDPYIGMETTMLPPLRSARPNVGFKEFEAEHLHETIHFPGKVEWQTVDLSLYDVKCDDNPIYQWLKRVYDPNPAVGFYGPSTTNRPEAGQFKTTAYVTLYSGCGDVYEQWVYMNAYPNKIDWGELDMASNELTTVDLTLRFDRAYLIENTQTLTSSNGNSVLTTGNGQSTLKTF